MAGTQKNVPAACCCGDVCKIDSFTAETAFTSDAIRTAEHPQSPYPSWLQAEVKAAVGDTLKLFLAWDEATPGDGLYVEFTPQDGATNGTLKLYRKDGTQLGTTLQLLCADETYWHLITACYDPDTQEFTACFDARDSMGYAVRGQCVSATVPTGFTAGRKAGYGGIGSIQNYKYERLWYCGDSPYTEECHAEGDEWDYAYDPLPPRTICHHCGSPSCTVVSESFAGIEGTAEAPGDMPCGWDADATDWGVVDGKATGNGEVCHKYDTTGGAYNVSATFDLGHLETLNDYVEVSLTHGDTSHVVRITRIAGVPSSEPDKYAIDATGSSRACVSEMPASVTIYVCPSTTRDSLSSTWNNVTVTPSNVCVSIVQPTLTGHEDASLTAVSIVKNKTMDDDCQACDPVPTCSIWSSDFTYPDCDWTLDSGDWPTGGEFLTSGAGVTSAYDVDPADATSIMLTWTLPDDWAVGLEIGDEIVFTFGSYTVTVVYVSDLIGDVPLYEATLSPATGADVTAELVSFTRVTFCVENGTNAGEWVVIANLGSTRLSGVGTASPGGRWGVSVTYTGGGTGFSVTSAGAAWAGPVETDSGRIICPGCYLTCTSCTDSHWPSGIIADIQGLETLVAAAWLDCSALDGPHYLGPNIYNNCLSNAVYWFGPTEGVEVEYQVVVSIVPYNQADWGPIGLSGTFKYLLKDGLVITPGTYLKVQAWMRPRYNPPNPFAHFPVWGQLWLKRIDTPIACSEFNEESVPWAGSFFYYIPAPAPPLPGGCGGWGGSGPWSNSVVKITAA